MRPKSVGYQLPAKAQSFIECVTLLHTVQLNDICYLFVFLVGCAACRSKEIPREVDEN